MFLRLKWVFTLIILIIFSGEISSQNRLLIGRQLQQSSTPYSIVVTDATNNQTYIVPGAESSVLSISGGIPTWTSLGALVMADNGVSVSGGVVQLGHAASGSGASDFTADRHIYTNTFDLYFENSTSHFMFMDASAEGITFGNNIAPKVPFHVMSTAMVSANSVTYTKGEQFIVESSANPGNGGSMGITSSDTGSGYLTFSNSTVTEAYFGYNNAADWFEFGNPFLSAVYADDGTWDWFSYGAGINTGTATYLIAVDNSGNVIEEDVSGYNVNLYNSDGTITDATRNVYIDGNTLKFIGGDGATPAQDATQLSFQPTLSRMRLGDVSGNVSGGGIQINNSVGQQRVTIGNAFGHAVGTNIIARFNSDTGIIDFDAPNGFVLGQGDYQMEDYGVGTFDNTDDAYLLSVDATGNVQEMTFAELGDSISVSGGGLWEADANGINLVNDADNVGIGVVSSSSNKLLVTDDQNAISSVKFNNTTAGLAASIDFILGNDLGNRYTQKLFSSVYTTSGLFDADRLLEVYQGGNGWYLGNDAGGGEMAFFTGGISSANVRIFIEETGEVGVGTITPDARQHLYGTGGANGLMQVIESDGIVSYNHFYTTSTGNSGISDGTTFGVNATHFYIQNRENSGDINLNTDDSNTFRVHNNGDVSIYESDDVTIGLFYDSSVPGMSIGKGTSLSTALEVDSKTNAQIATFENDFKISSNEFQIYQNVNGGGYLFDGLAGWYHLNGGDIHRILNLGGSPKLEIDFDVNNANSITLSNSTSGDSLYLETNSADIIGFKTNNLSAGEILSTQQWRFNAYGSGTYSGTATFNLEVDASGNIIETASGGGAADGNGIYDGSGTVPTSTVATLTDQFAFTDGGAISYTFGGASTEYNIQGSEIGTTLGFRIYNTDNTNTSSAAVGQATVGGASGGDAYFVTTVNAVRDWSFGIDNSDSDKFKIGPNANPSSGTPTMTMTTGGFVGVGGVTSPGGTLHVQVASTGGTANIDSDDLIVEGTGDSGMTIFGGSGVGDNAVISMGSATDNDALKLSVNGTSTLAAIGTTNAISSLLLLSGNSATAVTIGTGQTLQFNDYGSGANNGTDDIGVYSYDASGNVQEMLFAELADSIAVSGGGNIYNTNGTLTADRTMSMGGGLYDLKLGDISGASDELALEVIQADRISMTYVKGVIDAEVSVKAASSAGDIVINVTNGSDDNITVRNATSYALDIDDGSNTIAIDHNATTSTSTWVHSDGSNVNTLTLNENRTEIGGQWAASNDISATLTASQNNWSPTGLSSAAMILVDGDASYNITGINSASMTQGTRIVICNNDSADDFTLVHESASSTAANRFNLAVDTDVTITDGRCIEIIYDQTISRWRVIN